MVGMLGITSVKGLIQQPVRMKKQDNFFYIYQSRGS